MLKLESQSLIKKAFQNGQQKLLTKAASEESTKKGKLRGGNTGMMDEFGNIAGSCAARTYLRMKGVEVDPVDKSRDLMFAGGRANEDIWFEYLKEGYDGPILREEEIPTKWVTKNGIEVTGRPDIVLCSKSDDKPKVGIELKQIMSLWTARDVMFQEMPKTPHLMQAAHYSWQLGIPFELWYTNRCDFAITGDWPKNLFPKFGEKGSEHCEYAYYREGEINPRTNKPKKIRIKEQEYQISLARGEKVWADVLKILPFVKGYQLELREGTLWYRDAMVDDAGWVRTVIKTADIERYYNHIAEMTEVPPEPINIKANGEQGSYKLSDYCSLGMLCCAYNRGKDLKSWCDRVEVEVRNKK